MGEDNQLWLSVVSKDDSQESLLVLRRLLEKTFLFTVTLTLTLTLWDLCPSHIRQDLPSLPFHLKCLTVSEAPIPQQKRGRGA